MRTIAAGWPVLLAFAGGPAAAQEVVELEWLHDARVSRGVAPGEPIFVTGTTIDCESFPRQVRPRSVTEGSSSLIVEIEIETRPFCTGHDRRLPQAFQIGPVDRAGLYGIIVVGYDPSRPDQRFVLPQSLRGELRVEVGEPRRLHAYHTGIWSVPERPGEGVLVDALEQGHVLAYFGSDAEGRPLWLLSEVIAPDATRGTLYAYPGGTFDAPSGTPVEWGEIAFNATDELLCGPLRVELLRNGVVVKTLSLTKLASARSRPGCL